MTQDKRRCINHRKVKGGSKCILTWGHCWLDCNCTHCDGYKEDY